MTRNLETALQLASRGWWIFPCREKPGEPYKNKKGELITPEAKTPYWHRIDLLSGKDNATTNPTQINIWWQRWPDALIGIYCEKSSFFALDIDTKNGIDGLASWSHLAAQHNSQPIDYGPAQRTPSGGKHILFNLPDFSVPNNAGKLAPGLDLRSNGYICTGGNYQWVEQHGPDMPITDAPGWLLEEIRNLTRPKSETTVTYPAFPTTDSGLYWLNYYLNLAHVGTRNETGFNLACQLRDSGLSIGEADLIMRQYAQAVPDAGNGYSENAAVASLESAYRGAPREPARRLPGIEAKKNEVYMQPEPPDLEVIEGTTEEPTPTAESVTNVTLIKAPTDPLYSTWADMDKVIGPICWSWRGWLAKGFLHILVGMTGEGKSQIALRVAGCFLQSWDWPDGTPFEGESGYIVWCEAEAAQALNLERAKNWGLPIGRIITPLRDTLLDFRLNNPDHQAALANLMMRSDVLFAVVDSLSGADPTAEKSTEDAKNVNWLAALARDTGKPIILTHHLRKRGLYDVEGEVSLDRVRGISTILQYARLIWALDTPDLTDKENKRLVVIKSNLSKKPDPIGVVMDADGVTFGEAPETPKTETTGDQAVDLLLALLQDGVMAQPKVEEAFKGKGISISTMNRAKKKLGVDSVKTQAAGSGHYPQRIEMINIYEYLDNVEYLEYLEYVEKVVKIVKNQHSHGGIG